MISGQLEPHSAYASGQPPRRRGFMKAIGVSVLFLALHFTVSNLVTMVYGVFFGILYGVRHLDENPLTPELLERILLRDFPIIAVIFSLILIPIYSLFLILRYRRDSRTLLKDPLAPSLLMAGLAVTIGILGVTHYLFVGITWLAERSELISEWMGNYRELTGAYQGDSGMFWLIVGVCILAPIAEELLFRGIIFGELRRVMPDGWAVLLQGVLFAFYHLQPIQISYVIIPGVLLGLTYLWSGSIYVPIGMHILYNLIGSLVPAFVGDDERLGMIVFMTQTAFIVIAVLALVYLYLNRRNKKQPKPEILPISGYGPP